MVTWRIYFNRHREAPQVWSIDQGDQSSEVNVQKVVCIGCYLESEYNGTPANENTPSALFRVSADSLRIDNGQAIFYTGGRTDGRP